jgi:hypothetical protein
MRAMKLGRTLVEITRSGRKTNISNWQYSHQTLRCNKQLFRHLRKGEPVVLVCLSNGRALARLRDVLGA